MTERSTAPSAEKHTALREPLLEATTEPDESEKNVDVQPLYPQVQRAMDDLKRMIDEGGEDVRRTESGEPIVTGDILGAWAKEEGFGHGKRGTFHNDDTYVYVKSCNLVSEEKDVDKTLATARHLTQRGAIHPESQWGVFESDRGYQLFVVSPKLEAWSLDDKFDGKYEDRSSQPEPDRSHLLEWFQRVDPDFVPGQPIPEDSLLHHLNWTEASHGNNWGWDDTSTLFPVDVEVINPTATAFKNYEPWNPTYGSSESYYLDL